MALLGWTILAALLVAAAALVVAAAAPLRVRLVADSGAVPALRGEVLLLGGLLPAVSLPTGTGRDRAPRARGRTRRRSGRGLSMQRAGRMARAAPRLLRDLLARVDIEEADLEARFGLGDPAATGALYGQLAPLLFASQAHRHLRLAPDFVDAGLDLKGRLTMSVRPGSLLPPVLRFAWASFGPVR